MDPTRRPTPALDRAVDHLRRCIGRMAQSGEHTLPGIRTLARQAKVSLVTMWKAVQVLRQRGVLRTVSQGRVLVGDAAADIDTVPPAPRRPSVPRVHRWVTVKERIARDILAGRFGSEGIVPAIGELRIRYGTGHATLRTALESLLADSLLERYGRGFRVTFSTRGDSFTTVVFVGRARTMDMMTDLAPRSRHLWRALESRCSHCGVGLLVTSVEDMLERPARAAGQHGSGVTAGYVVRNLDLPAQPAKRLLSTLLSAGRPVALADELGGVESLTRYAPSRRLRVFSLAHSVSAGQELGRYLLSRRHRRVAFLSPYAANWSTNRLQGLRAAYEQAGLADAVRPFVGGELADDFALRDRARSSRSFADLCAALRAFRRSANPVSDETDDAFSRDPAFTYVLRHVMEGIMEPLFGTALADSSITAWVGANDAVALAALRFLDRTRSRGRAHAAARISVAGFDNTFEAMAAGLTSYDFNVGALADAMVRHVLGPARTHAKRAAFSIEIPGLVVGRASVAPVSDRGMG